MRTCSACIAAVIFTASSASAAIPSADDVAIPVQVNGKSMAAIVCAFASTTHLIADIYAASGREAAESMAASEHGIGCEIISLREDLPWHTLAEFESDTNFEAEIRSSKGIPIYKSEEGFGDPDRPAYWFFLE